MSNVAPTWRGYARPDGSVGARNLVLVVYTVNCAAHVAHAIAHGEENVHVVGAPSCTDNALTIRLLLGLARNPNVGAVLAVGLGCEYTRPDEIARVAAESGRPADWLYIQESGGTAQSIDRGKRFVRRTRETLEANAQRVEAGLADLVVAAECGGSDFTSGLAANRVVGEVFDRVVDAGGTAIFEEVAELIGLRDALVDRAASPEAAAELAAVHDRALDYCKQIRQYSVSPGNFAGGLTTIEEKSAGAYAKSGSRPIQGVLKIGERAPGPGLWVLDTIPEPHYMQFGYVKWNDAEGVTSLIGSGAQVVLFTTGRGSCNGSAISPVIKITGNSETYRRLEGDMDFDAGLVLSGETTMDEAAEALLRDVVEIAGGRASKSEALGHREYLVTYKHQEPPEGPRCRLE